MDEIEVFKKEVFEREARQSKPLSHQQEMFVEAYLRCWNAAEAARRAGYSERTARTQGSALLKRTAIAARIRERLAERTMGTDEVLARLTEQARGDMGDFLATRSGTKRSKEGAQAVFDLERAREEGKSHLIKSVTVTKSGLRVELYSAQKALTVLSRHLEDGKEGGGGSQPLEANSHPVTLEAWREGSRMFLQAQMRADHTRVRLWSQYEFPISEERRKHLEQEAAVADRHLEEMKVLWKLIEAGIKPDGVEDFMVTVEDWRVDAQAAISVLEAEFAEADAQWEGREVEVSEVKFLESEG